MCGIVIRTLEEKALKDTQLKLYKLMAVAILLYGLEC